MRNIVRKPHSKQQMRKQKRVGALQQIVDPLSQQVTFGLSHKSQTRTVSLVSCSSEFEIAVGLQTACGLKRVNWSLIYRDGPLEFVQRIWLDDRQQF